MTQTQNLDLLQKQITDLREELDNEIKLDTSNLSSPRILEINNQIDKLLLSYIKISMDNSLS